MFLSERNSKFRVDGWKTSDISRSTVNYSMTLRDLESLNSFGMWTISTLGLVEAFHFPRQVWLLIM